MQSEEQSFASWKFDWIDALGIGTKGRDLSVAIYILQRCGSKSREAWPTQELMALVLGCDVQTVERAVKSLARAGVLVAQRKTRNGNLHYRFIDDWKDQQLAVKQDREEQWRDVRASRSDPSELIGAEHETDG